MHESVCDVVDGARSAANSPRGIVANELHRGAIDMQIATIGLDIAKNVFKFTGSTRPRRSWFGSSITAAQGQCRVRPSAKTHGRTSYRLADRLGVSSVAFVALDVCLRVFRRH